jgi:hypothetical protein
MSNGAPGRRACTESFKLDVIARWHRERGASPENPATVGIGFSTDEIERVGNARRRDWEVVDYPLLTLGLSRAACADITARAGLPPAPKSACWFCPMHSASAWREMRRDHPDRFAAAVGLERLLNERRDTLGRDHVYLARAARPLDEAITEAQPALFDADAWGESCDEGTCFV